MRERGAAMLHRVEAEALAVLDASGAARVRDELCSALLLRERYIEDDHDPRYLHTARTIRILIADAGCADAVALAAAATLDTVDAELASRPTDSAVAQLAAACPRPAPAETLLERLVTAPEAALMVTVAERLDHARHLHLRPELPWAAFHREVLDAYLPAAARVNAALAHRLDRWADAFTRHLLRRGTHD